MLERCAPVPLNGETLVILISPLARIALGKDLDGKAADYPSLTTNT